MKTISFFLMLLFFGTAGRAQEKKRPYLLFEEAERQFNAGNYAEAVNLLDQCLKIDPVYMEAYSLRGSIRELQQDNDGALTDYSIYLERIPNHPEVLMSRAVLRFRIGFLDQAREDFNRLLTFAPAETNAVFYKQNLSVDDKRPLMTTQGGHKAVIYNYLGLIAMKEKIFSDAVNWFDTAIYLDNKEPDYFVNRGLAKEATKDTTALQDYGKALRLNPSHTLANHNLKALLAKQGKTMTYEDRLTETIESDSTMLYPYLERAQQRFESGYFKGAIDDYSHALEIEKHDAEIWLGRGLAREKVKDFGGAFSDYTKAIELNERFVKAWINRANILFKQDRFQEAVEDYSVALIYVPDYAPAFYNRAIARSRLKQEKEACDDLKQAENLGMKVDQKLKSRLCK